MHIFQLREADLILKLIPIMLFHTVCTVTEGFCSSLTIQYKKQSVPESRTTISSYFYSIKSTCVKTSLQRKKTSRDNIRHLPLQITPQTCYTSLTSRYRVFFTLPYHIMAHQEKDKTCLQASENQGSKVCFL